MKKVKIPESFGSGDVTITINGVPTKVPFGKETEVPDEVAGVIEAMMNARKKEPLTDEEIKARERKRIGAASAKEVEELKKKIEYGVADGNEVAY